MTPRHEPLLGDLSHVRLDELDEWGLVPGIRAPLDDDDDGAVELPSIRLNADDRPAGEG